METKHIIALFVAIGVIGAGSAIANGVGVGPPKYDTEVHQQMMDAIEAGDYQAWKSLIEENNLLAMKGMSAAITEENFSKLQELHQAMLDGDYETANELRKELGMGYGHMKMRPGPKGNDFPPGHMGVQKRMQDRNGDGFCDFNETIE